MINDGTAQSFFNYSTVCLTTPDLYNKYFRHAYESFLYSNLRVRFVYMQLLIYFQEGWKLIPCGSSSRVISLILRISCVFFFRRAPFPFNLCSALWVLLVRLWFELTPGLTWGGAGSVGQGSSACLDAFLALSSAHGGTSLLLAITENRCPSFQTQIYSCPTRIWFMSCYCCSLCGGRSGSRAQAVLCV